MELSSQIVGKEEVKKTKKVRVLIPLLMALMLCVVAVPVVASGPLQAWEVGHNPNLSIGPSGNPVLDAPSGVHNVWSQSTGAFNHWITASMGGGKINNAVTVGLTGDITLPYLFAHLPEFENKWLYFSQTTFRTYLFYSGYADYEAEAARYPDGIYWNFVLRR